MKDRNVTFHNLIRANKRKSALLVAAMSGLMVVLGAIIGGVWGGGDVQSLLPSAIIGAAAAAIAAIGASVWSYYGGSNAILTISGAKELHPSADRQLFNVVEELSIAAGIPMPKIFVIPSKALNAFATGRDPEHGSVAITTGLRQKLSRDELAAVMAHEISHIRHYDIRFAMLMATMVGLIVMASDVFMRSMWYGGMGSGSRRGSNGKGNPAGAILLILGLVLAVLAPFLAGVIRFAMSREREYLADAGAVELTRYPQGMIGALKKLGASKEPLPQANRATAHLYVVNPLKNAARGQGHQANSVFRTHPPLAERIKRLELLLAEYDRSGANNVGGAA